MSDTQISYNKVMVILNTYHPGSPAINEIKKLAGETTAPELVQP